ncbi:MAG TPA: hypothetical protein VI653_30520, partial [Steroidobacteraceae bacterium]
HMLEEDRQEGNEEECSQREVHMHSYGPDWLGAIIAGVFVGLAIQVTTGMVPVTTPGKPHQTRRLIIAALIGVALAFIVRNVLGHLGI